MLAELVRKAERTHAGLSDRFDEQARIALPEHLADYRRHLEMKGDNPDHVSQTIHYIELIVADCRFQRLHDLDASRVENWLQVLKTAGGSNRTINYYLTAIRGFCRWLVVERRMSHDPLAHLKKLNEKTDVRVERRNLPFDQFARLIEAARQSERTFRRLTGRDRAMLYTMAAYTGLRASALASLKQMSVALEGSPPTITVDAAYTKGRRRDIQPLPEWLAEQLREWLADHGGGNSMAVTLPITRSTSSEQRRLWPGSWSTPICKRSSTHGPRCSRRLSVRF